jgi:hypothetical protein
LLTLASTDTVLSACADDPMSGQTINDVRKHAVLHAFLIGPALR